MSETGSTDLPNLLQLYVSTPPASNHADTMIFFTSILHIDRLLV